MLSFEIGRASRVLTVGAAAAAVLFLSSSARAEPPPAAGSPVTTAAAPAPAAAAPAGAPAGAPAAAEEEPGARFRWGISAIGGPVLYSGASSGAGGIDVRLGAQVTPMFGVYAQPVFIVGGGASASGTGASASALALVGGGVLADVTLGNIFYVAAGPDILAGGSGSSSVSTSSASSSGSGGTFIGIAARAGLALGSMKPERRKAFTVGLDFRAVFTPDKPTILPLLALGYDAF